MFATYFVYTVHWVQGTITSGREQFASQKLAITYLDEIVSFMSAFLL